MTNEVRTTLQKHLNHVTEYNKCLDKLEQANTTMKKSLADVSEAIMAMSPGNEADYVMIGDTCLKLSWGEDMTLTAIAPVEDNLLIEGKVLRV